MDLFVPGPPTPLHRRRKSTSGTAGPWAHAKCCRNALRSAPAQFRTMPQCTKRLVLNVLLGLTQGLIKRPAASPQEPSALGVIHPRSFMRAWCNLNAGFALIKQ